MSPLTTILLPGFFWPEALHKLTKNEAPNLHRLLRGAKQNEVQEMVWSRALWQTLGGQGDLPLAQALRSKYQISEAPFVIRADPAHVQVGRDDMSLANPFAVPLTEAEAKDLVQDLNAHLAVDGFQLVKVTPRQWLLCTPEDVGLNSLDPWAAVGQAMGRSSPFNCADNKKERTLKRVLTEVQMLLYAHPVNAARQARGAPAINSLWLWAGGAHFVPLQHEVVTDCINAQTVLACMSAAPKSGQLFYLTGLIRAYLAGDLAAWTAALREIDKQLTNVEQSTLLLGDGRVLAKVDTVKQSWWSTWSTSKNAFQDCVGWVKP